MEWFSDRYADARGRFLAAAHVRGAGVTSHHYPHSGPNGDDLYVDIARMGSAQPKKALIVISGTHGVEGFCGSACQTAWLERELSTQVDDRTAVYVVHALNPYGFAWLRRVTHDNVDLNRNFLDFEHGSLPSNPVYAELSRVLNPVHLDEDTLDRLSPDVMPWLASPEKVSALKAAIGKGQYDDPRGILFGGTSATWCNVLLRTFVAQLPPSLEHGVVLDVHTGLGDYGTLEIFSDDPPSSRGFKRCTEWFAGQRVTSAGGAESLAYAVTGSISQAFVPSPRPIDWTYLNLEFGTESIIKVLLALQADNWLHCFAKGQSVHAGQIRSMMRDRFNPPKPDWQEQVVSIGCSVIDQALEGLRRP